MNLKRMLMGCLVLVLSLGLLACGSSEQLPPTDQNINEDVDRTALLEYLKNNITTESTADEIIEVFRQMCQTPIAEDLLLNEYGAYDLDFTGKKCFYYNLVRQFPDGEGEFYQIRVSMVFSVDDENSRLFKTIWSDSTDEDFFTYIRRFPGYDYVITHEIRDIEIRIEQT